MYTKFEEIRNINDVLPHLDTKNFIVANKEGYTVINYILPDKETFPEEDTLSSRMRIECRGIIFCNVTGNILRRPYQKFFNLGERESLSLNNLSNKESGIIFEKIDGSMIAPFILNGAIVWGTKMGATHITPRVEQFVSDKPQYRDFVLNCIQGQYTPIFEWTHPEDRIVIDYGKDPKLTLVAIRHMITGEYADLVTLNTMCSRYNIPLVGMITDNGLSDSFVEIARKQEEGEGYVVHFQNGNKIKIKNEWYCQIHKAKSYLTKERHVVELILSQKIDDLKSLLLSDDLKALEEFEANFSKRLSGLIHTVLQNLHLAHKKYPTKKDFALCTEQIPKWLRSQMFKHWDVPIHDMHSYTNAIPYVCKSVHEMIVSKCTRDSVYQETMIEDVLKDLKRWNPVRVEDN